MYAELEEEAINKQVDEIKQAHVTQQHGKAWNLINQITGRKNSPTGKLKAKNQEERKKLWHDHFKKLLGENPSREETTDVEINTILDNLNIKETTISLLKNIEQLKGHARKERNQARME